MKTISYFGNNPLERVNKAIAQLQAGKGILLIDDEDRENEGDIIFAAQNMSVADMALTIRHCSGIVCLCITPEKAEKLNLHPMVSNNTSKNQTAFTISIEAKEGVTTGVSAKDRIQTIRVATATNATPSDLARPGHVFPLIAKNNGVFERRGHTEGSVDLVKLAGLGSSAVLCELMNDDGTMSRTPEIAEFAIKHGMTVVTIEDIYQYRKYSETSVPYNPITHALSNNFC